MNANELRVDNWITDVYAPEGKMFQVKEIHKIRCIYGNALFVSKYENLKPIPLSPEILEKCGFVYRNEHRGVGCIMDLGNIASVGILENGFRYLLLWQAPLKYLHQLQNIYFAHFGEELTFKQ